MPFLPDGSGIPISMPELAKDPGDQTENAFSDSTQCAAAANKARRLILMIWQSFQALSKSFFSPLYGALVRPHLEYGMQVCLTDINHEDRILRLAEGLVIRLHHVPYEERLPRQRVRVDICGPIECGSAHVFLSATTLA